MGTTAAVVGGSALGGIAAPLIGDALRDDPPAPPSPPRKVTREVEPGVKMVRERNPDGTVTERRVLSAEKKAERRRREQMVDELFGEIPTTSEERQKQFQDAKSAFMEEFKSTAEEQFDEQDQDLRASQTATGRQLSSVGAQEREDLQEAQQQEIASAARSAEQRRQQLVDREQQRNLQQIKSLRRGLDTDIARQQQALNSANQTANTIFSNAMARNQAKSANVRSQNQAMMNDIGTGLSLGSFAGSKLAGAGGGQRQAALSNPNRLTGSTIDSMQSAGLSNDAIARTSLQ